MSLPVIFSPGSLYDLNQLELYLARRFFPKNAERYVGRIVAACVSIGLAPHRGQALGDIRPGTRTVGFEKRVAIVYEIQEKAVAILGVFYGGRRPQR